MQTPQKAVYLVTGDDIDRIHQMVNAFWVAIDSILDKRELDCDQPTLGLTDFDRIVDRTIWDYLDL